MSKNKGNNTNFIQIKGARIHNLKKIDVNIPRNQLIVITGVSGSGKSSLAFDTLYAEGQRRYVESLSSYARQFLRRINKPEADFIKGIPPAIAIEQKVNTRNPRSTVGTSTEIYDYIKLLYTRIGKTISPVSGRIVERHNVKDVVNFVLSQKENSKILIQSPIQKKPDDSLVQFLKILLQQGFSRVTANNYIYKIQEIISGTDIKKGIDITNLKIVLDRIIVKNDDDDTISRIADSVQTAFYEGEGICEIYNLENKKTSIFSTKFEADGITFQEPDIHTFSFNNPMGACPKCEGFGKTIGIDEDLVVPDKNLSIYEDAIICWRGEKMKKWKKELILNAHKFNFLIHKPYFELQNEDKQLLWTGNKYFKGLNKFFSMLEENQYKIQYRVMLSRFRGKTICPDCKGSRLRKEAAYIKVNQKSIQELVNSPISELLHFFHNITLEKYEKEVSLRLLKEIINRLEFLIDVGLSYLTLNRMSSTLSGGESQRINLATSLGSSLVGSLYILDEPSIGLHSKDTSLLIKVLRKLQKLGNTVIVVEHDEEIMRAADYIIDVGPLAGILGGEIVFNGTINDLLTDKEPTNLTAKYLNNIERIPISTSRRKWNNCIKIWGARENNLKGFDVKFPLNILTVVTGVSGSGKSSLVKKILYPAVKKYFGEQANKTGSYSNMDGNFSLLKNVEFIDQNPLGKSSRSNPATYLKLYDEIRTLFSEQKMAKKHGFKPSHFSCNIPGGRCDECDGEGTNKVEMQFMADLYIKCETCQGKRFKENVLEVKHRDKNIYNILELTVKEAISFFNEDTGRWKTKILQKLQTLYDVGLEYVTLGQSSSTLSGGENQRVKLAYFLSKIKSDPFLFIFDEPTIGLHFHDIKKLLNSFNSLILKGHTIIIIEHNLEIIKSADWIIDLGLKGGEEGGIKVFEGTPEEAIKCKEASVSEFLKEKLK